LFLFKGDSSSTLVRFFNGNGNNSPNGNPRLTPTTVATAATSQVQINQPKVREYKNKLGVDYNDLLMI